MHLWNDIRYGARTLRKAPGFAAAAAITLALGIGATAAVFGVADALLWKPVNLPHLESLVGVVQKIPGNPNDWSSAALADIDDIRRDSSALADVASWNDELANIAGQGGEPESVPRALVTTNFFAVMGVQPVRGRTFAAGEDQPGRQREAILSDRLWHRRFGADPDIVGKTIRLDDQDYQVIGIMPSRFQFPLPAELWTPLALTPEQRASRRILLVTSMGRLKPGHTVEQARAQMDATAARLERLYPATNKDRRFQAYPAHRFLIGDYTLQYTLMTFYAALFVLLIACVNVANLQFARATGRMREIAVRTALGAGRGRVVAQLVTENVLLALVGAALGLLVASWGLDLMRVNMPAEIARYILGWEEIHLDGRTLGFTLAAALASGILAGIAPAWQLSRPDVAGSLKEGGRGSSAGRARHRFRNVLVAAEIALTVVLLVCAGLMVRGFRTLLATGTGMQPETLLTLHMTITPAKYGEPYQVAAFYRQVLEKTAAVPGVRASAAATALPFTVRQVGRVFMIEGQVPEPGRQPSAEFEAVSPNFFRTLHVPLRAGRLLSDSDRAGAPRVAVIGERTAQRWWPGEPPPLGRRIRIGAPESPGPWVTLVGVVGDVAHDVFDRQPRATLYVPYEQAPLRVSDIAIRAAGDPLSLVPGITAAIRSVDPQQPVTDVYTMTRLIRNDATGLDYVAALMAVFGGLALALSAVGVYGVMSYLVAEQTHEIGIRVALGAPRQFVLGMLLRRGMTTAAAGLAIGLVAAYGLARLMASLVFGVEVNDLVTFTGISLALMLVAALAIYIPARRAMRIDPIMALRYE